MLREAVELAEQGRAVYVIAADCRHAALLEDIVGIKRAQDLGIKFEGSSHFDWDTLRFKGSHPNCAFLIDHYAIERRFSSILSVLHRYDP